MPTSSDRSRANDAQASPPRAARGMNVAHRPPSRSTTLRAAARQRGVALLLMLTLAVVASAFVVLRTLNEQATRETAQRLATVMAMAKARRALIGYAVGYADGQHADSKGPGLLPCPDRAGGSAQGVAESTAGCSATAQEETGLLPFRTLGLTEMVDGSGAPLWYAVSENFRSMADPPVNSETPGTLHVDNRDDVVAVIIAPGAALPGQLRGSGSAYTPSAWLEGDNASVGDNRYTNLIDSTGNDTVMAITRGELMREVEKVVSREVANALATYYHDPDADDDAAGDDPDCPSGDSHCDDGLPWLAPRSATSYAGVVGHGSASLEHLPVLELRQAFNADFAAQWSVVSTGTYAKSGAEPPPEGCLRRPACTQNFLVDVGGGVRGTVPASFPATVTGIPGAPWTQGTCTLDRATIAPYARKLDCSTSFDFVLGTRALRRVYRIEVAGNTRVLAPTASARRELAVLGTGSWPGGVAARITVSTVEGGSSIGAATLDFTSLGPFDSLVVLDVPYDLEVWNVDVTSYVPVDRHASPGALPLWFSQNEWQQMTFAQYAPSEAPGYTGTACQVTATCFTLSLRRPGDVASSHVSGLRGVVVAAGPPLSGATTPQTRPSSDIRDYLEGQNALGGTTDFERRDASSSFNDQVLDLSL